MEPTLSWLETNLSLTKSGLSHLVRTVPAMFRLMVDSDLDPTLKFCTNALSSDESARKLLVHYPCVCSFDFKKSHIPRLKTAADAWARKSWYNPYIGSSKDGSLREKVDELVAVSMDLARLDDVIEASNRDKCLLNHRRGTRNGVKIDKWRPLTKEWEFCVD
mmetsp:Transcript_20088/g.43061  ORF Transcript_20088/g.43061 Transcript_20088/m.43061 type:complete len:162 (-) Transcript_20088:52-537(-)